jgi:anti-sigma regulatory factor (Ser/Thr protein kinase)
MNRSEQAFEATVTEVGAARHFAEAALANWEVVPDDIVLVVSELASNAVRHAGSDFKVSLEHLDGAVVVGVTDANTQMPETRTPRSGNGRGLLIVDRVARTWGVWTRPDGGKTVWAEVPIG